MKYFGDKYRSYKSKLKAKYYKSYDTTILRRDCNINLQKYQDYYYYYFILQEMFRKDIENRAKQVIRHTFGSKSYDLIRYYQIENL